MSVRLRRKSNLMESAMNSVDEKRQPHQYFGEELLPSHHFSVPAKGSPIKEIYSNTGNSTTKHGYGVEPQSDEVEQEARKKKDGGMMSRSPTLPPNKSPTYLVKTPSLVPSTTSVPKSTMPTFSPTGGNYSLDLRPTKIPTNSIAPSSRNGRLTAYVSVASSFALLLLFTLVGIHLTKKRRKVIKFYKDDPALCGDESIESEHSSTFQCIDDINSSPGSDKQNQQVNKGSTVTSKTQFSRIKMIKEFFVKSTKTKNNKTLYFQPTMPYLAENYATSVHCNATDETTTNDLYPSSSGTDESQRYNRRTPVSQLTSFPRIMSYPKAFSGSIVEERERNEWRLTIEDNLGDPTLLFKNCANVPTNNAPLTKQKLIDDESTGSIAIIYPEIVRQVMAVDQSLAEGLNQLDAANKQFTIEFDKLESLVASKEDNISDYDDEDGTERNPSSSSSSVINESLEKEETSRRLENDKLNTVFDAHKAEAKHAGSHAVKTSLYKSSIVNSLHRDEPDDISSNDEDENQNNTDFSSSRYPAHLKLHRINLPMDNPLHLSEQMSQRNVFSNPPSPLLVLTSKEEHAFVANDISTDEDDILSTGDSNEGFDFHSIRKRFNN